MEYLLFKVFICVADEGSLSAAAKKLNYVQSNITARLKQLEENIGHQLFYRKPRGVVLTSAGERLLPHARDIVKKIDDVETIMKDDGELVGKLHIGSTESNAALRLAPMLINLHKAYPKLDIQLTTGPTQTILSELLEYKLDVAFVSGVPSSDELAVLRCIDEPMVLIEPEHGECPDVLITFKKGCTYKEIHEKIMANKSTTVYKTMEFGSLETILGCVSAGMGRALLPLKVVEKYRISYNLKVVELSDKYSNIPTCMVCRKDVGFSFDLDIFSTSEKIDI